MTKASWDDDDLKRDAAARTMLEALEAASAGIKDALKDGEYWRENFAGSDLPTIRKAIRAAKAAGIGEG